ncbi:MAG TPA: hypothetical protein VL133_13690 [Devosia sp.]|nr:hypothetical protein [Devosia sp.]
MLTTAALVLVIYSSPTRWQEVAVAELPTAQCTSVMEAIWAAPLPIAFTDEDGNDVKTVDAWCSED